MADQKKLRQSYQELQVAVQQIQQEVMGLRQAFTGSAEVLAAIISVLGEETVQAEMNRLRQEAQAKAEGDAAASVKVLVDRGVLVPTAEIGENTLVVGQDALVDGSVKRVQFEARGIKPEFRSVFIGKKVGEQVTNNGVTFTVVEVYNIDMAKAAELQMAQQQAQQMNGGVAVGQVVEALPVDPATQKAIDESGEPVAGRVVKTSETVNPDGTGESTYVRVPVSTPPQP